MDIKRCYTKVNYFRGIFLRLLCKNDTKVLKDIERWKQIYSMNEPSFYCFNYFLLFYPCFRNLIIYRIRCNSLIKSIMARILYKPIPDLIFGTADIGGGLFIEHGFSTIISAKSMGENCWINQQVTIGYTNGQDSPIIGNNVRIGAGAIVIGNVYVGDDAVVGAGTVVTHDVPAKATIVGNKPLQIYKKQ